MSLSTVKSLQPSRASPLTLLKQAPRAGLPERRALWTLSSTRSAAHVHSQRCSRCLSVSRHAHSVGSEGFSHSKRLISTSTFRSAAAGEGQSRGDSGPSQYRPTKVVRDLPQIADRRPILLVTAAVVVVIWTLFTQYATNKEKLSSSVFRSVVIQLKDSEEISDALGYPVTLEPGSFGDPWVTGAVNMMQGKVDIRFRIKGTKGAGTAYFTSIRRDQGRQFEVLRFLVQTDAGEMISMLQEDGMTHDQDGDMAFA